ncbi:MAG: hypothetical protein ACE5K7_04375 [Phycisphaerae bacterium]
MAVLNRISSMSSLTCLIVRWISRSVAWSAGSSTRLLLTRPVCGSTISRHSRCKNR